MITAEAGQKCSRRNLCLVFFCSRTTLEAESTPTNWQFGEGVTKYQFRAAAPGGRIPPKLFARCRHLSMFAGHGSFIIAPWAIGRAIPCHGPLTVIHATEVSLLPAPGTRSLDLARAWGSLHPGPPALLCTGRPVLGMRVEQ